MVVRLHLHLEAMYRWEVTTIQEVVTVLLNRHQEQEWLQDLLLGDRCHKPHLHDGYD
jgi:hypothetical protein